MAEGTPIIVKKKKVVAGGHHGGSWKVAYADFVTAMMAFFMVMWIMGMDDSTRSKIQGYFNDPFGAVKSPPRTQSAIILPGSPRPKDVRGAGSGGGNSNTQGDRARDEAQLKEVQKDIEQQIQEQVAENPQFKALLDHLDAQVTAQGLRIEFTEAAGSVFFVSGSDQIRPEARDLISAVAPILTKARRNVIVEGHTDAEPYKGMGYSNWDLSTDRAQSLRRLLAQYGVPETRFVEVRGFADTRLKTPEDPYHFSNRRVTVLLPFRTVNDVQHDLPSEAFKEEIQGAFVKPVETGGHE